MTDDEIRDYIERNTLNGALSRLHRELRALLTAIRQAPPVPWIERMIYHILNGISRLLS